MVAGLWVLPREERAIRNAAALVGVDQLNVYVRFAVLLVSGDRELAVDSLPTSTIENSRRLAALRELVQRDYR